MSRHRVADLPWRERGEGQRRARFYRTTEQTWPEALYAAAVQRGIYADDVARVRMFIDTPCMRQFASSETAIDVLHLINVVDRVNNGSDEFRVQPLCARIMLLDLAERALLYYDCCAVLGYDPAEGEAPSRR